MFSTLKLAALAAMAFVFATGMTGCYELTGECSPGPCADATAAQADGGGKDQGRVGPDSDGAGGSDAIASSDDGAAGGSDGKDGSDATPSPDAPDAVTKLCPPEKRPDAVIEYSYKGQTLCLSAFEQTAFEILDTHKGVPAVKCADFGDPDYCFAEFLLAAPSSDDGCFDVTMTHPQAPDVSYKFTFQKCDAASGLCVHEKKKSDGSAKQVTFDVNQKLFTYKKIAVDGTLDDQEPFKLVPK